MADAVFAEPRLAAIYDAMDSDRSDLAAYLALTEAFGARSLLDIGCGTGTFACLLAARGVEVTGIDPAPASLEVARRKPFADRVQWLAGIASDLLPLQMDLATMTGNVAQVFLRDDELTSTFEAAHAALNPGGRLVFEVRDPDQEAWRRWNRAETYRRIDTPAAGWVETWQDVTAVDLPFVTFLTTFVFESDGAVVTSESTLRFRSRVEITDALRQARFTVEDVRDAPDRPGLEFVFIATAD
jgi:SAM-dependent methyltransferase